MSRSVGRAGGARAWRGGAAAGTRSRVRASCSERRKGVEVRREEGESVDGLDLGSSDLSSVVSLALDGSSTGPKDEGNAVEMLCRASKVARVRQPCERRGGRERGRARGGRANGYLEVVQCWGRGVCVVLRRLNDMRVEGAVLLGLRVRRAGRGKEEGEEERGWLLLNAACSRWRRRRGARRVRRRGARVGSERRPPTTRAAG